MRKWVVEVVALMVLSTVSVSSYAQEPPAEPFGQGVIKAQQLGIK